MSGPELPKQGTAPVVFLLTLMAAAVVVVSVVAAVIVARYVGLPDWLLLLAGVLAVTLGAIGWRAQGRH